MEALMLWGIFASPGAVLVFVLLAWLLRDREPPYGNVGGANLSKAERAKLRKQKRPWAH
jgi:hypothetical protein